MVDRLEGKRKLSQNRPEADIAGTIAGFRDDELAHKRTAEENGAREAIGYPLLKAVIGAGCKLAIRLSEKL